MKPIIIKVAVNGNVDEEYKKSLRGNTIKSRYDKIPMETELSKKMYIASSMVSMFMNPLGIVVGYPEYLKIEKMSLEEFTRYKQDKKDREYYERHYGCRCNSGGFDTHCPLHSPPKQRGGW